MINIKGFLLGLAFLLFGCQGTEHHPAEGEAGPEQLLLDLLDEERFISVDQLAEQIIQEDPILVLVDVRPHDQFDAFALPGAVNIPLEEWLDEPNHAQLDCERYSIVYYSNGTLAAEQAWILDRRNACRNNYILKGGLNEWAEKILSPKEPPATASSEEFERYRFRKGAALYFIGAARELKPEPFVEPAPIIVRKQPPKKIEVKPKKKQVVEEEGC